MRGAQFVVFWPSSEMRHLPTVRDWFVSVKIGISLLSQAESQFTGTSRYVTEVVREFASMEDRVELDVLCNRLALEQYTSLAAPGVQLREARGFRQGDSRYSRLAAI